MSTLKEFIQRHPLPGYLLVPPTVPVIGVAVSFLSLLPTMPWLVLIARRFWRLSRM